MDKPRRSSRLRRTAWIAAVWLLGGAALTWASAWGIALLPRFDAAGVYTTWFDPRFDNEESAIYPVWVGAKNVGREEVTLHATAYQLPLTLTLEASAHRERALAARRESPAWVTESPIALAASRNLNSTSYGFGWPRVAMSYTWTWVTPPQSLRDGWRLTSQFPPRGRHVLPLRVHPIGLVVDTLVLGACVVALVGLGNLARSRARRKRGLSAGAAAA